MLVVGRVPHFRVCRWIPGADTMREELWRPLATALSLGRWSTGRTLRTLGTPGGFAGHHRLSSHRVLAHLSRASQHKGQIPDVVDHHAHPIRVGPREVDPSYILSPCIAVKAARRSVHYHPAVRGA